MGADLYILKMEREKQYRGFEVSKDAVDAGYFRDCYNSNGLFSFLNANSGMKQQFSWWQLSDKKGWFDEDPEWGKVMNVNGAKKFLSILEKAQKKISAKADLYREDWNTKGKVKLTENQSKEYEEWLGFLISFLRLAIKQKSPIGWSV